MFRIVAATSAGEDDRWPEVLEPIDVLQGLEPGDLGGDNFLKEPEDLRKICC